MTDYRFPTRIEKIERLRSPEIKVEAAHRVRGEIQGSAASFAEYMVALVLYYLKLAFTYKYRVRGTAFTVDFRIDSGAERLALDVVNWTGGYETNRQRLRRQVIEHELGARLQVIYDTETGSFEDALEAVRRVVR
jgi:hypothetical protein